MPAKKVKGARLAGGPKKKKISAPNDELSTRNPNKARSGITLTKKSS